jgi:hypothetical protein
MRSAAFEQALGRAKEEKDIETFLQAAEAMAKAEPKPQRRAELLASVGDETLAISRFYRTLQTWRRAAETTGATPGLRAQALEKMAKLGILLRDLSLLAEIAANPAISQASPETRQSLNREIGAALQSPIDSPAGLSQSFAASASSDEDYLAAFKGQFKMSSGARSQFLARLASRCGGSMATPACKWSGWPGALSAVEAFDGAMRSAPTSLESIEPQAGKLAMAMSQVKALSGSGDPQLDILLALGSAKAYQAFADYLLRAAQANPPAAQILQQKAKESQTSARASQAECRTIIASANLVSPTNAACASGRPTDLAGALRWPRSVASRPPTSDPRSADIDELQKKIFANRTDPKLYSDLAELYLAKRQPHHAAAVAAYAMSVFPQNRDDFGEPLGCALARLGRPAEAMDLLAKASGPHKQECIGEAKDLLRAN